MVVDPYLERFVELVDVAKAEGDIRNVNVTLLSLMLGQISAITRDKEMLRAAGLTGEEAVLEIDRLLWDGICKC